MPEVRDGFRVIVDSQPLAEWLLEVLRPHLPAVLPDSDGYFTDCLYNLNERCRILCYTPGQEFAEHHDGSFTHPISQATSRVTVQVYLHDVAVENGGATTFLFDGLSDDAKALPCQPGAGSVLLFTQDLLHEGSLLKGGLKYTLRTEAMYKSVQGFNSRWWGQGLSAIVQLGSENRC